MNYHRPKKRRRKKFLILSLTALFLIYLAIPALAETIQELEQQKANSQQVINNIQGQVSQRQSIINDLEQQILEQNNIIASIESEIGALNSQISVLNTQIVETQQKLDETIAEETRQNELIRQRLKVEYMYGTDGYLEAIFSGETPTEQLENSDIIAKILIKDKEILQQLADTRKTIEETKAQLENQKQELNDKKAQVEEKLSQQQAVKNEKQKLLDDNEAIISQARKDIADEEASIAAANGRIQELTIIAEREALAKRIEEISQKEAEAQSILVETTKIKDQLVEQYQDNGDSKIADYIDQVVNFTEKVKNSTRNIEKISENTQNASTAAEAVEVSKTADTELTIIYENNADTKELRKEIAARDLENSKQAVEGNPVYETAKKEAAAAKDKAEEAGGQVISVVGTWERDNISTTGWRWPLDNNFDITSVFGYRIHPIFGSGSGHEGVDIAASTGTPIHACDGGTVIFAGSNGGYGNCVIVQQYTGHQVYYAHQSRINVQRGQIINKGDVVGYVGSTGWSTGPHLHLGVTTGSQFIDPFTFFPEIN